MSWVKLFRPWSLAATIVPFLVSTAIVGKIEPFRAPLAVFAGAMLQFAVNLLNTWGDARSGVDDAEGAFVSTPQLKEGLVTAAQVRNAAIACLVLAACAGVPLFFESGAVKRPLVAIAAIGMLGATNYATGLKFKYHGLGTVFVFFLMGYLEIAGFAYAISPDFRVAPQFWVAGFPVSCLVAAILHGNDMRDISSDRAAGIKTLATVLGRKGSLALYFLLHLLPFAATLFLALSRRDAWFLLPLAAAPLAVGTLWRAATLPWFGLERHSGLIHLLFGALWTISLR